MKTMGRVKKHYNGPSKHARKPTHRKAAAHTRTIMRGGYKR